MAKVNLKKKDDAPGSTLGEVRGYARKIWLAGLGAYARVGQEGSDYFKELVKAGEGVEKRGKKRVDQQLDAANNQIDEATVQVSRVRGKVEIQLDKGDLFVTASDGVHEARDAHGNDYGDTRLREFVQSLPDDISAEGALSAILEDVARFSGRETPADDRTVIVLLAV